MSREDEATRVMSKFPGRFPVFLNRHRDSTLPQIDKNKYLVPGGLSWAQFQFVIRKRLRLNHCHALFMSCSNSFPCQSDSIDSIYEEHKARDGFLYVEYMSENVFGDMRPRCDHALRSCFAFGVFASVKPSDLVITRFPFSFSELALSTTPRRCNPFKKDHGRSLFYKQSHPVASMLSIEQGT